VVAFEKRPESADEVLTFVFGEGAERGGHLVAYDNVAHYGDVSATIYGDIEKSATVEEMVEVVRCKYSYLKNRDIKYSEEYFCSDVEKAKKLVELGVLNELLHDERSKAEDVIMKEHGLVARFFHNSDQYDKEEEKRTEFKKSDEFRLVEDAYWDKSNAMYKEMDEIAYECARADVELFMKDNEGAFFVVFNYGDDSGNYFAAIEHGNTFKRLPHIVVSKH
jgi:hypothetical protein